jgi:prepilin-type N-terminal cleavage/methylation domain-containing protein
MLIIHKNMNKKGFTLIEMVVSVFLITVAVVGVVQITTKYIQQTKFEKESYVAALLGQEGIEIIKNIRDTNWVDVDPTWNNGLTTCSAGCEIDMTFNAETPVFTAWSAPGTSLYIENSTKLYKYISSPGVNDVKSIYTRKITIDSATSDILKIIVDVYWRGNTTTVKEDIYNWKQ